MSSSIRVLPPQPERVESGPIKFDEDWHGVFVHSDDALDYVLLLDEIAKTQNLSLWYQGRLGTLRHLLLSYKINCQKSPPVCRACGKPLGESEDPNFCEACLEMHQLER
jgi:hypothetical protein